MLQSSQKLEVVTSTAMGQQQTSVGCDYLCYHYSPLLQGCRNILDCYERLDVIAQGTYGIVWKARDKDSQEIVALKQIKDVGGNEGFPILALREMQALLDLSHDCIVSIREVVVGTSSNEDLDKVFMVFPVRT
jgi:cell division cycle 2-like protein